MTTILATTNGDYMFDNEDAKPPTNCPRCQSTQLAHDYTAGEMSDEYSDSTCQVCGMVQGYCMGFWHYQFRFGGYHNIMVSWRDVPSNHPFKGQLRSGEVSIDYEGKDFEVGEFATLPLSAPCQAIMQLIDANRFMELNK